MLLEIRSIPRRNPSNRGQQPRVCDLQCDVCGARYERPYSRVQLEAPVHRCSTKCVYGSRSSDGLGGHGATITVFNCDACGKEGRRNAGKNTEPERGMFCNKKCYDVWLKQNPQAYAANTVKMHTPEAAAKISARALERTSQSGYVHSQTGLKRSEETIALLRRRKAENPPVGEKNGMFGKRHKDSSKEAMSDKHSTLLLRGLKRPYGGNTKKGDYVSTKGKRSYFYRSGWEQDLMIWLDANPDVASWDYECVRIPYYYDNHKRWYVPDFIVTFHDGHREMWEVKPKEFVLSEKVVQKSAAASEWCKQNDVLSFRTLTGDDLRTMHVLSS